MRVRWFQIHLSTAVVLALIAGGILGLNLLPIRSIEYVSGYDASGVAFEPVISKEYVRGFPLSYDCRHIIRWAKGDEFGFWGNGGNLNAPVEGFRFSVWPMIANALSTLIFLVMTAFVCEWAIRRKVTGLTQQ